MKTGSFSTCKEPGRISIARFAPRFTTGHATFKALAPGPWFNKVPKEKYIELYTDEILAPLDPQKTWDALHELAKGHEPVLLCYEKPPFTDENWCHRRLVAAWFTRTLGHEVLEMEAPPAKPRTRPTRAGRGAQQPLPFRRPT